jgi:hypothetical protein
MYTVSPEFRATQMGCEKIHGTPVCKEEGLQTGTGLGYYVFGRVAETGQLDNLPVGYEWELHAAVEMMGIHAGNIALEPAMPEDWKDATLYLTGFNGHILSVEPMFPPSYT